MSAFAARVLIAETPAARRPQYDGMLRAGGMKVHAAPDGQMALDLCRIVRPDVLVLDSELPVLDGQTVLERLRADHKIGTTPVVVVVDEPARHGSAELEDEGTYFLARTGRPADLLARVLKALKARARLDALIALSEDGAAPRRIDILTGLPDRRATADALAAATRAARQAHQPMGIALVGIDDFRSLGTRYGDQAVDDVVCALAGRLGDHIEMIGRWSASEFVALLPGSTPAGAAETSERLREASSAHAVSVGDERRISVTVSVGWACSDYATPDRLLRQADVALYEARGQGHNTICPPRALAFRR